MVYHKHFRFVSTTTSPFAISKFSHLSVATGTSNAWKSNLTLYPKLSQWFDDSTLHFIANRPLIFSSTYWRLKVWTIYISLLCLRSICRYCLWLKPNYNHHIFEAFNFTPTHSLTLSQRRKKNILNLINVTYVLTFRFVWVSYVINHS